MYISDISKARSLPYPFPPRVEEPLLSNLANYARNFDRILDVGCDFGRITYYSKYLWPKSAIVSVDLIPERVLYVKRMFNVEVLTASGLKLPFREETFDLVICTQVVEHLSKESQISLLRELVRVLRAQGYLYLTSVYSKLPFPPVP